MTKYARRPFEYLDNVLGVELNFNKIFYQPEKIRNVAKITADLDNLEKELKQLETDFSVRIYSNLDHCS